MPDLVIVPLSVILDTAGLSISDVCRISGMSRTTLYKITAGEKIRRTTAIKLLTTLYNNRKTAKASIVISQELAKIGSKDNFRRNSDSILSELEGIASALQNIDHIDLDKMKVILNALHNIWTQRITTQPNKFMEQRLQRMSRDFTS